MKKPSKPRYVSVWKPMSENRAFWNEVLKGRTITKLEWKKGGLAAFHLDDGQRVFLTGPKAAVGIKD